MTLYQRLLNIRESKGSGYFVLLDPDKGSERDLVLMARTCEAEGVDGLLVGGSLLFSDIFDKLVKALKQAVSIPVILFPGNGGQLSKHGDGILFMSITTESDVINFFSKFVIQIKNVSNKN